MSKNKLKVILFILTIICLNFSLYSVEMFSLPESPPYFATHYTLETGLPHLAFEHILQDKRGFLYFSTIEKGLYRYDGFTWSRFSEENSGLGSDKIIHMVYDGEDNLYIAHKEAKLTVFNINTGRGSPLFEDKLRAGEIKKLFLFKNVLYIGTDKGIYIYDIQTGDFSSRSCLNYAMGFTDTRWQSIGAFFIDSQNRMWLGSRLGLSLFNGKESYSFFPFETQWDEQINGIGQLPDGRIITATNSFLGLPDEQEGTIKKLNLPEAGRGIEEKGIAPGQFLLTHREKFNFIFTGKGVFIYNSLTEELNRYTYENRMLVDNSIFSAFIDREENIWITTDNGITKLRSSPFSNYRTIDGHSISTAALSNPAHHLMKNSKEGTWLYFNEQNFAYEFQGKKYSKIDFLPVPGNREKIKSIFKRQNTTFLKTEKGYYTLSRTTSAIEPAGQTAISSNSIIDGVIEYRFYYSSPQNKGLLIIDPIEETMSSVKLEDQQQIIPSHNPEFYFVDSENFIVLYNDENKGYKRDSFLFNTKTRQIIPGFMETLLQEKYPGKIISVKDIIHDGRDGFRIALESPKGLIYKYSEKTLTDISEITGTRGMEITAIKKDSRNRFFITTASDGLILLEGSRALNFNTREGLPSNRISGGISIGSDGTVYLLSSFALSLFDENKVKEPVTDFHFYKALDRTNPQAPFYLYEIPENGFFKFPAGVRDITLYGTLNSFLSEKNITYQYRFRGDIKDWTPLEAENFIKLPTMEPGSYTLEARARDHVGNFFETRFSFTIPPYWYETPLAVAAQILAVLLLTAAIIGGIIKLYTRRLKLKAENLEQLVTERTAKLKKTQKELIEAAHTAGKAEIAAEVLHNVGNIMTKVNISSENMIKLLEKSKVSGLSRGIDKLKEKSKEPRDYLKTEEGLLILDYFDALKNNLEKENHSLIKDIRDIHKSSLSIRDVIGTLENYAHSQTLLEAVNIIELLKEIHDQIKDEFRQKNIRLVQQFPDNRDIVLKIQKSKLIYILMSLYANAAEAVESSNTEDRAVKTQIHGNDGKVFIRITDNGIGIPADILPKLFNFGFTTKEGSPGCTLHTCANFIARMNGTISAESDGPGKGATFILIL